MELFSFDFSAVAHFFPAEPTLTHKTEICSVDTTRVILLLQRLNVLNPLAAAAAAHPRLSSLVVLFCTDGLSDMMKNHFHSLDVVRHFVL